MSIVELEINGMKTIRAKFNVVSVTEYSYGGKKVELTAQYASGKPEDNQFAKATPSGNIVISIDNPDTKDFLIPGVSYYVDFTKAE
jgi:hypothetical protein